MQNTLTRNAILPLAFTGLTVLSVPVAAYEIDIDIDQNPETRETLELYGVIRLSVDYADSDLGDTPEDQSIGLTDGSVGLSSNTTLFGLRGSYGLADEPYKVVWQLEQKFNPDNDGGDTLGTRDTFLGLQTPVGLFRAGHMDTPYKRMGLNSTIYSSTVGDPHAIIGKSSQSPARLDLRAQNAIQWNHGVGGFQLAALYSMDGQRSLEDTSDRFIDNNDGDLYSLSASYALKNLTFMGTYENWSEAFGGEIKAWRAGIKYQGTRTTVGAMYGDIDTDLSAAAGTLSREEYAVFARYKLTPRFLIGTQWARAGESDFALGDDGADQYSVGAYYLPYRPVALHVVATMTDNDDNGRYGTADYAHGDRVSTVRGGSPFALSVGAQYSF
ncbi:porin [Marinobacter sp. GN3S48]|uniref:porin n=1 Tax=Marinobacter sp. GN3S48 TaxID=3382302 RepID=UPI00387B87B1